MLIQELNKVKPGDILVVRDNPEIKVKVVTIDVTDRCYPVKVELIATNTVVLNRLKFSEETNRFNLGETDWIYASMIDAQNAGNLTRAEMERKIGDKTLITLSTLALEAEVGAKSQAQFPSIQQAFKVSSENQRKLIIEKINNAIEKGEFNVSLFEITKETAKELEDLGYKVTVNNVQVLVSWSHL